MDSSKSNDDKVKPGAAPMSASPAAKVNDSKNIESWRDKLMQNIRREINPNNKKNIDSHVKLSGYLDFPGDTVYLRHADERFEANLGERRIVMDSDVSILSKIKSLTQRADWFKDITVSLTVDEIDEYCRKKVENDMHFIKLCADDPKAMQVINDNPLYAGRLARGLRYIKVNSDIYNDRIRDILNANPKIADELAEAIVFLRKKCPEKFERYLPLFIETLDPIGMQISFEISDTIAASFPGVKIRDVTFTSNSHNAWRIMMDLADILYKHSDFKDNKTLSVLFNENAQNATGLLAFLKNKKDKLTERNVDSYMQQARQAGSYLPYRALANAIDLTMWFDGKVDGEAANLRVANSENSKEQSATPVPPAAASTPKKG